MNVFGLRQRLVAEYADSTRSLMTVGDSRIRELIEQERERGLARPDPWFSSIPPSSLASGSTSSCPPGCSIECAAGSSGSRAAHGLGQPLRLHRHEADAVKTARSGAASQSTVAPPALSRMESLGPETRTDALSHLPPCRNPPTNQLSEGRLSDDFPHNPAGETRSAPMMTREVNVCPQWRQACSPS